MQYSDITDPIFLQAVKAIDNGDLPALRLLLLTSPDLVIKRLDLPEHGYFSNPYLSWFVANNPIRHEKLPANIVAITQLLVDKVQAYAPGSFQQQVDYTLALVATGRIPRECGVQVALIDLLMDAGAVAGNVHGALAHGNLEAARRLIERGSALTLAAAVCLDMRDDVTLIAKTAGSTDLEIALVSAAFYGKTDSMAYLISLGVHVNAYLQPGSGFHHHATALHQAVSSASMEAVKILVEAGADIRLKDTVYQGTPLDWAVHLQTETNEAAAKQPFAAIEAYLRNNN